MVRLVEGYVGEGDEEILVFPVYEDFILETPYTRFIRNNLKQEEFSLYRREIKKQLEDRKGAFIRTSWNIEKGASKIIYYLNARIFLEKMSFLTLSESVQNIFLDILEKDINNPSIAISLMGIDYFSPKTELEILCEGIRKSYDIDHRAKDLPIFIYIGEHLSIQSSKTLVTHLFSPPIQRDKEYQKRKNFHDSPKRSS